MKIKAAALLLACAAVAWAQESNLSVSDPAWRGLAVSFLSRVEPEGAILRGGVTTDIGRMHHVIEDGAHRRYFGYDLLVEASPDARSAQLRIEPLHPTAHESKLVVEGWTMLALPRYPVISNVKPGETVAIDLLVNPATGQKVVDYLTLKRNGEMDLKTAPRDFALADVELRLDRPRVSLDGKTMASIDGGTSGAVVWVRVEGRGRFIVSLLPQEKPGFRKNGIVSANGLLFHDGASEIRVECGSRIVPASGVFHLYVLAEPDWRGQGEFGSADRAAFITRKH